jgi:hypothetical protein
MEYPKLTSAECRALAKCSGMVQPVHTLPGVGPKRLQRMLDAGMIRWAEDEQWGEEGYIATEYGEQVLHENRRHGRG